MNLLSDQVDKKEIDVILRELSRVIARNIPGDIVEFGCYVGTTSVFLARAIKGQLDRELYVYDSFEGLPEKTVDDVSPLGLTFKPGELFVSKKQFIKNMQKNGVTVSHIKKGWFSELNQADIPSKVAFAFLDGDYYKSVADPLRLLKPVLQKGAVVVVDDYANPALPGAAKAVNEWSKKYGYLVKVEHSLAIITVN